MPKSALVRSRPLWLSVAFVVLLGSGLAAGTAFAASHNVAPIRTITGSNGVFDADAVACTPSGVIYSTNNVSDSVTVYAAGAHGKVAPSRTIKGADTAIGGPIGIAVDGAGRVYVSSFDNDTVTEYAAGAHGDAAPIRTLGVETPRGIAFTPDGHLWVASEFGGSGGDGELMQFTAGASLNTSSTASLDGASTGLDMPMGVAVDSTGHVAVSNVNDIDTLFWISVFAASPNGDVAPIHTIQGAKTGLDDTGGLAYDSHADLYAAGSKTVRVFAPGATGNVSPRDVLGGAKTGLIAAHGLCLDSSRDIVVANSGVPNLSVFRPLVPLVKAPGRVRALAVSGSKAAAHRTVSWKPPASNGGSPITKYEVVIKWGAKKLVDKTVTRPRLTVSRSVLRTGTDTARVRAFNAHFAGPYATTSFKVRNGAPAFRSDCGWCTAV